MYPVSEKHKSEARGRQEVKKIWHLYTPSRWQSCPRVNEEIGSQIFVYMGKRIYTCNTYLGTRTSEIHWQGSEYVAARPTAGINSFVM